MFERLEQKRLERKLSVRALSERSGIPESTYNNIVKGRSANPSIDTMRALCMALEMPIDDLFAPTDDGRELVIPPSMRGSDDKPATNGELNTITDVLVRLIRSKDENYQSAIKSRNEEFERALTSKDSQFDREREFYRERLSYEQSRRRTLTIVCAILAVISMFFIAELMLDRFVLSDYGRYRW